MREMEVKRFIGLLRYHPMLVLLDNMKMMMICQSLHLKSEDTLGKPAKLLKPENHE